MPLGERFVRWLEKDYVPKSDRTEHPKWSVHITEQIQKESERRQAKKKQTYSLYYVTRQEHEAGKDKGRKCKQGDLEEVMASYKRMKADPRIARLYVMDDKEYEAIECFDIFSPF